MDLPTDIDWDVTDNGTLFDMSLKYANGDDGVETDYVVAHIFLNIASSRGCKKSAEYRKELSFDMSKDEISQAQKVARELLFGNKTKMH